MSTHIESKKEDIANIVLMPGDPKRCEYIAKNFLAGAHIINNVRGMTAYTGNYKNKRVTNVPRFNFEDIINSIKKPTPPCWAASSGNTPRLPPTV